MQGRLETELRYKHMTEKLLIGMPEYVSSYYYSMQISKEPLTYYGYIVQLKHYYNFLLSINIDDMTSVDEGVIGRYFESIAYGVENGKQIKHSFSYSKRTWTILNQFYSYLKKKKLIDDNPMEFIDRPSNKDVIERKFLTMDDLNAILQAVKETGDTPAKRAKREKWVERNEAILVLFMTTGMRRTALSEINLQDIDWKNYILTVTDKRHKTQVYKLSPAVMIRLFRWKAKRYRLLNKYHIKDIDALFISFSNNKARRLGPVALRNLVMTYSKEALGYSISPHKLRAAFISLYYEASGGDIEATKEAVGHSDISTTSIYITQRNDARKEAMQFMTGGLNI